MKIREIHDTQLQLDDSHLIRSSFVTLIAIGIFWLILLQLLQELHIFSVFAAIFMLSVVLINARNINSVITTLDKTTQTITVLSKTVFITTSTQIVSFSEVAAVEASYVFFKPAVQEKTTNTRLELRLKNNELVTLNAHTSLLFFITDHMQLVKGGEKVAGFLGVPFENRLSLSD